MLSFRFSPALIYVSSAVRGGWCARGVLLRPPFVRHYRGGGGSGLHDPAGECVTVKRWTTHSATTPHRVRTLALARPSLLPTLRAGLKVRTRWGCRSVGRGNGCAFARLRCVSLARLAACLRARLLVACAASRLSLRSWV